MENSMEFPWKIKNKAIVWPRNHPSGSYPKELRSLCWKDISTPMFIATLFIVSKVWRQSTWPLVDWWIYKVTYMYVCVYVYKCYPALKKNEVLPFAITWIDLEDIMLSELSQRQINIAWSHLYVKSKKFSIIVTKNRMVVTSVWSVGGMGRCLSRGLHFQL